MFKNFPNDKFHHSFFSYFLTTASASYGACYTFNSELNPDDEHLDSRISSMTGPFFGLSLVLNLQQKAYLKGGITKQVSWEFEFLKKYLDISMISKFLIGWW